MTMYISVQVLHQQGLWLFSKLIHHSTVLLQTQPKLTRKPCYHKETLQCNVIYSIHIPPGILEWSHWSISVLLCHPVAKTPWA